jgi:hypothetical protein
LTSACATASAGEVEAPVEHLLRGSLNEPERGAREAAADAHAAHPEPAALGQRERLANEAGDHVSGASIASASLPIVAASLGPGTKTQSAPALL